MEISLQGPLAGAVAAVVALFLLFAPIERLARKPSPISAEFRSRLRPEDVPVWMKIFFRGLGVVLLALAAVLLAPLFGAE